MYVMGTGSRQMVLAKDRREVYENLRNYVVSLVLNHPDLILITGMAEGWDEAIAKVGLREGIPYVAYVPNKGYGNYYWGQKSLTGKYRLDTFNELLAGAKEIIYVCDGLYDKAGVHANFVRNQRMVNACDSALVYMPESRGTADAVRRLKEAGKPYRVSPF